MTYPPQAWEIIRAKALAIDAHCAQHVAGYDHQIAHTLEQLERSRKKAPVPMPAEPPIAVPPQIFKIRATRRKKPARKPAAAAPVPEPVPESPPPELEALGCRRLLFEVLKRAAFDWVLYADHAVGTSKKTRSTTAFQWLFREKPGDRDDVIRKRNGRELVSFLSICMHLDLDPELTRKKIRELSVERIRNAGRPPEHSRPYDPSADIEVHAPDTVFQELDLLPDALFDGYLSVL